ncbi:MAG: hypothetical protein ACPKPY_02915 [Nitrososphaeraceae archaeon]
MTSQKYNSYILFFVNLVVVRNSSNLKWNAYFNTPIKLWIDKNVRVGSHINFQLTINQIDSLRRIKKIIFTGFSQKLVWNVDLEIPCNFFNTIQLPNIPLVIPISFIIEGEKDHNIKFSESLNFKQYIIATNYQPIFDARLAASHPKEDERIINPLKRYLNSLGFRTLTLGKELITNHEITDQQGNLIITDPEGFKKAEKEWASTGDCFIAILTKRDITTSGEYITPAWISQEIGLAYDPNKPIFIFAHKKVKLDGLLSLIDNNHVVIFDDDVTHSLNGEATTKIISFRNECNVKKNLKYVTDLANIGIFGLAVFGAIFLTDSLNKIK